MMILSTNFTKGLVLIYTRQNYEHHICTISFNLHMTPSGRFYCYAVLFEETEAQGMFNTLSKVTQLISD